MLACCCSCFVDAQSFNFPYDRKLWCTFIKKENMDYCVHLNRTKSMQLPSCAKIIVALGC